MKSFHLLIGLLTLTAAALLPGLPELDAQGRCPRGVQIQQYTIQAQKTFQYQQQIYQQQQMVAKKQWEQARQLQVTQQQRQVKQQPQQLQQTKTAMQTRSVPAQVPVAQTKLTASSRQITTQVASIVPHGPGTHGCTPTTIHTTTRTIDSYLLSRRVDMVPVNRSLTTQSRSVSQQPNTLTTGTYGSRQLTAQSRTLHQETRTLHQEARTLHTVPKTCTEQITITVVKWNMNCVACHQKQGLPYPTGPHLVHAPKQQRPPDAIPLPPMPLPDPLVRLPGTMLYPWVQPPRPAPVALAPQRPLPDPWVRPDSTLRPVTYLRPDVYAWTKPTETKRTPDSPGNDPIAIPKTGPKKLDEAIVSGDAPPRLLPAEVLEMPTPPAGTDGLTRGSDHAAPEAVELRGQDEHSAPQVRQTPRSLASRRQGDTLE